MNIKKKLFLTNNNDKSILHKSENNKIQKLIENLRMWSCKFSPCISLNETFLHSLFD